MMRAWKQRGAWVLSGCALVTIGCAGPAGAPAPRPAVTEASPRFDLPLRVDVVPGRPLIIPLDADSAGRPVSAALAGGRQLEVTVHRVWLEPDTAPDGTGANSWLSSEGNWASEELRPGDRAHPGGLWVARIVLPPGEGGEDVVINGRHVATNWLPPPANLPRSEVGAAVDPWLPTRPAGMPAPVLDDLRFSRECRAPLSRWRWLLLKNGLHPEGIPDAELEDPIAADVARVQEDRWRVALARLWGEDPDLAMRLKQRLSAVVEFGPGVWAPAWGCDRVMLDRLLADLLDPTLGRARRAAIAERWLEDQIPAVAWVVDDGGTLDSTRRHVLPSVGLASLLDRATLSWAGWKEPGVTPDLQPLASMTVRQFIAAPSPEENAGAGRLSTHVGRWSGEVGVLTRPLPLTPPGLTMTPFFLDWSMDGWLMQRTSAPAEAWLTAALLHRPPEEPGAAATASRSKRWEVFVECKLVEGQGDPSRETVYLYTGPLGRPTAIVRVSLSGVVENLPVPGMPAELAEIAAPPATTTIVRGADRWAFRVPLPPGSVERDGIVRLGLMRVDALGRRSATPRPMLPWQTEPPRIAVDTSSWGGAQVISGR